MIIFGGNAGGANFNDTWVLANANGLGGTSVWSQLAPGGTLPVARSTPALVYDRAADRIVIFGGSSSQFLGDIWSLSQANGLGGASAWTQVVTSLGGPSAMGPSARATALSGYNSTSQRLVIFGGVSADGEQDDVWMLPL